MTRKWQACRREDRRMINLQPIFLSHTIGETVLVELQKTHLKSGFNWHASVRRHEPQNPTGLARRPCALRRRLVNTGVHNGRYIGGTVCRFNEQLEFSGSVGARENGRGI